MQGAHHLAKNGQPHEDPGPYSGEFGPGVIFGPGAPCGTWKRPGKFLLRNPRFCFFSEQRWLAANQGVAMHGQFDSTFWGPRRPLETGPSSWAGYSGLAMYLISVATSRSLPMFRNVLAAHLQLQNGSNIVNYGFFRTHNS